MEINGIQYAIPLRTEIHHPHVLWTDKKNYCGVDFSKAEQRRKIEEQVYRKFAKKKIEEIDQYYKERLKESNESNLMMAW